MFETRRVIIALKIAAQNKHVGNVAKELHRLMQLAGISPCDPGEVILTDEQVDAGKFWCMLLQTDPKMMSNPLMHKSTRSMYAIMRVAMEEPGWKDFGLQAHEYCQALQRACAEHLHTLPQTKVLSVVRQPPRLSIVRGTKNEAD